MVRIKWINKVNGKKCWPLMFKHRHGEKDRVQQDGRDRQEVQRDRQLVHGKDCVSSQHCIEGEALLQWAARLLHPLETLPAEWEPRMPMQTVPSLSALLSVPKCGF
jgi:hypothetical protein